MGLIEDRQRAVDALKGLDGVEGVRIGFGERAKICVDVSPGADLAMIKYATKSLRLKSPVEVVPSSSRGVARAT